MRLDVWTKKSVGIEIEKKQHKRESSNTLEMNNKYFSLYVIIGFSLWRPHQCKTFANSENSIEFSYSALFAIILLLRSCSLPNSCAHISINEL